MTWHCTIRIFNDNQAAQNIAVNPVVGSKSKHISIKERFIRETIQKGDVAVCYQKAEDMIADIFTK